MYFIWMKREKINWTIQGNYVRIFGQNLPSFAMCDAEWIEVSEVKHILRILFIWTQFFRYCRDFQSTKYWHDLSPSENMWYVTWNCMMVMVMYHFGFEKESTSNLNYLDVIKLICHFLRTLSTTWSHFVRLNMSDQYIKEERSHRCLEDGVKKQ